ncbi:MAG: TIGR03667 family PPOX class F420-dependent oxidoreductase [Ktedonobacteraceae bacterium]|nr:TIGR03667 family PPOX class F420-dependent oxidoreductase [Ktedonobacteraceae bacterium]
MKLDTTQPGAARIDERLRSDIVIWLGTVRADGRPHLVAVWFLWDGDTFLIFSQPGKQKVRNLQQNRNVVLALDNTQGGDDVIVVEGQATLLASADVDITTLPAFEKKYSTHIKQLGMTPEAMAQSYSQPIRIVPTKFVGLT